MKPKDIKAGLRVTVGWFTPGSNASGFVSHRRDYLASGTVILRRGCYIKFRFESGDDMNSDFHGWPRWSSDDFKVSIFDIKSINGIPVAEWEKLSPEQFAAKCLPAQTPS